jgi:hypothetical protein
MKKPTLRVTKWLADIPVEAHCPTVSFKAQGTSHRPNREEYQKSLQAQFDVHCEAAHSETRWRAGHTHPKSEGCSGTEDLLRGLLPGPGL